MSPNRVNSMYFDEAIRGESSRLLPNTPFSQTATRNRKVETTLSHEHAPTHANESEVKQLLNNPRTILFFLHHQHASQKNNNLAEDGARQQALREAKSQTIARDPSAENPNHLETQPQPDHNLCCKCTIL